MVEKVYLAHSQRLSDFDEERPPSKGVGGRPDQTRLMTTLLAPACSCSGALARLQCSVGIRRYSTDNQPGAWGALQPMCGLSANGRSEPTARSSFGAPPGTLEHYLGPRATGLGMYLHYTTEYLGRYLDT